MLTDEQIADRQETKNLYFCYHCKEWGNHPTTRCDVRVLCLYVVREGELCGETATHEVSIRTAEHGLTVCAEHAKKFQRKPFTVKERK